MRILNQRERLSIERAEADLGEVGQENIGEIDHQCLTLGVDRQDRQGNEDRVGVVLLDGLIERRAGRGGEVDVLAEELEIVADAAEGEHPFVTEIERRAGAGRSPSDHHRRQDRLLELMGLDLGVKVLIFFV